MAHHLSSSKSFTHRSSVCVESHSMFDVSNLAPRDQFEAAVAVSGMCLVAAILLREWFADREIRVLARILGVAGWAVVVAFAWKLTVTNETLATQLMVKGKQDATSIADPVRVVAVASEYQATTAGGLRVSVQRFDDGGTGPVSVVFGCDRFDACSTGDCTESSAVTRHIVSGSDRRTRTMSSREF